MSAKQDRVPARTPEDLKRQYNFGESFADAMGIATDAQKTADAAQESANSVAQKMNPEDIFNILTDNGALQGMFRGEDGEIYINASYLKTGKVVSADGNSYFDLETGTIRSDSGVSSVEIKNGDIYFYNNNDKLVARMFNPMFGLLIIFYNVDTESIVGTLSGDTSGIEISAGGGVRFDGLKGITITCYDEDTSKFATHTAHWKTVNGVKTLVAI